MLFDYIKCPLNKYTFKIKPIREWVESQCSGKVLNLFAGPTRLDVDEIRNDMNEKMDADFHMDALEFVENWEDRFETIILDPPYSYRKSMEMYKGFKASPFRKLKDALPDIIIPGGKIITFGYHSNVMGEGRGFNISRIALFSHGGAIHDTIASVETKIKFTYKDGVLR